MNAAGDRSQETEKHWPNIPIIVLNWNGLDDTRECMHALLQLDYPRFQVYLIDNGSVGREGAILESEFHSIAQITVLRLEANLGFTGAHNWILPRLLDEDYPYIALLNNDTVPDRHWLRELVSTAEGEGAHVVASKLIDYFDRRKLDNVGHQMLTTGEVVPIGFGESPQDYTETRENFGSCGGATLYSMDMIRTIGFFDPYFSTGYEDAEFGVRAVVAGYRSVLAPKACVYHKISRSVQKVRNDGYELMIRDAIWYTYFKLMPKELTRRAWPRLTAKFGMGLMANLVLLRFKEIRYALESLTRARSSHLVNRARNLTSPVINRSLRWQEIYARQTKFVMHDAYRFWKILIG